MDSNGNPLTGESFAFTFHGSYTRAVDAKGRFNLPFRLRQGGQDPGEERYVVTWQGADGVLSLLPYEVWVENFNRLRQQKPSRQLRAFLREMSVSSTVVAADKQGRVAIPPEKLAEYGIAKKITVVGMGNYMELWSPEALEARDSGEPLDEACLDEFFR
jgi:MraZ protein